MPAANCMPSTRLSARACEDTSITAALHPCRIISASSCWTSGASGVVRDASRSSVPSRYVTVPRSPAFIPRGVEHRRQQIRRRRLAVGAGHADQPRAPARVVVETRRRASASASRASLTRSHGVDSPSGRALRRRCGSRAALPRLRHELRAISLQSAQRDKNGPRRRPTRVVDNRRNSTPRAVPASVVASIVISRSLSTTSPTVTVALPARPMRETDRDRAPACRSLRVRAAPPARAFGQ